MEFSGFIWAGLPDSKEHAAAQASGPREARSRARRSRAQDLTARTACQGEGINKPALLFLFLDIRAEKFVTAFGEDGDAALVDRR